MQASFIACVVVDNGACTFKTASHLGYTPDVGDFIKGEVWVKFKSISLWSGWKWWQERLVKLALSGWILLAWL